tara:strand:- start:4660 stop:5127 length:468 start_codon:yes stop_codon:yes gene_type:complete
MSTLKELLTQAKTLQIKGRTTMDKAHLIKVIAQYELATPRSDTGGQPKHVFKRAGQNLSGNSPFVRKIYSLGRRVAAVNLDAQPKQVRQILTFMADSKIKATGGDIIKAAVTAGVLKTKIKDHRELFGFYAKRLQAAGVSFKYDSAWAERQRHAA